MKAKYIGRAVKTGRLACGFTQVELAEKAGVSRMTVYRIENGMPFNINSLTRLLAVIRKRLPVGSVERQGLTL